MNYTVTIDITPQVIVGAVAAFIAFGGLVLSLAKFRYDRRSRKPHAKVTFVKARVAGPRGKEYRAVRVVNDGAVPFVVAQIGLYGRDSDGFFIPLGDNVGDIRRRPRLAPGDPFDVVLPDDIYRDPSITKAHHAFARIASGEEFFSKPIREDLSALASLV